MAKKYFTQEKTEESSTGKEAYLEEEILYIKHLDKVIQCQIDIHHDCETEQGYYN